MLIMMKIMMIKMMMMDDSDVDEYNEDDDNVFFLNNDNVAFSLITNFCAISNVLLFSFALFLHVLKFVE